MHNESADLYRALMEEVKLRTNCLTSTYNTKEEMLAQFVKEFCYLQLRLMFEVIAIGCVVLHRNEHDIRKLEKLWNANQIMPILERLNPNFFPFAINLIKIDDVKVAMNPIEPVPMTKDDFVRYYGRCGDQLHRGTLRRLVASVPPPVDLTEVREIGDKLFNLLRCHRILSADEKTQYICMMETPPDGAVKMFIGKVR